METFTVIKDTLQNYKKRFEQYESMYGVRLEEATLRTFRKVYGENSIVDYRILGNELLLFIK